MERILTLSVRDFAIITIIGLILAYYVGANKLLGTVLTEGPTALYAIEGKTSSGQYPNYPSGG